MIGGNIEQNLLNDAIIDCDIDDLLDCPNSSDKRVLVFSQASVKRIANASGEKPRVIDNKKGILGKNKKKKRICQPTRFLNTPLVSCMRELYTSNK